MKYGLRQDEAFKKREDDLWKNMVENEIKCLKTEVALGKKQIEELVTLIPFLAPNTQTNSIFKFKGSYYNPVN